MTDPLKISFGSIDTRIQTEFRKDIAERIADATASLANGAASDFADYRFRCGRIAALNEALEAADEARKRIQES